MNDPTIEHFVLGQFVHYVPTPPPLSITEDWAEEPAPEAKEQIQQSETAEADEETTKKTPSKEKQGGQEGTNRQEDVVKEAKREDSGSVIGSTAENVGCSGNITTETCTSPGLEAQNATIIGVHRDDFPNIYYTIRMDGSDRERQTVASRLTPRETREEAEARLAEIQRKKVEDEKRRQEEALEELARQEREAILKRKLEEKTAAEATTVSDSGDFADKSRDKKLKNKKSMSDKVVEKCLIS